MTRKPEEKKTVPKAKIEVTTTKVFSISFEGLAAVLGIDVSDVDRFLVKSKDVNNEILWCSKGSILEIHFFGSVEREEKEIA